MKKYRVLGLVGGERDWSHGWVACQDAETRESVIFELTVEEPEDGEPRLVLRRSVRDGG